MPNLLSPKLSVRSVQAEIQPSAGLVFKHYLASAGVYGLILIFYELNPWFRGLLSVTLRHASGEQIGKQIVSGMQVYYFLYVAYVALALPIYLLTRPAMLRESKNLLIVGALCRMPGVVLKHFRSIPTPPLALTEKEKQALMFLLVKLFYGPLMLNSGFGEVIECQRLYLIPLGAELVDWLDRGYIMFYHGIFLVDSCLFFIGYHSEAGFLRNKLRYVETNLWHILVCIACYGPFNLVTGHFFGRSDSGDPYLAIMGDYRSVWTWVLRGAAVLCLLLLISSSASLFTRASNLTNRGIVTWGPFRYIRHPGYLGKNLFWLITLIPLFIPNTHLAEVEGLRFSWWNYCLTCICVIGGFLGWGTLYFLRALTEERFLSRDPEYVAYCKKVKWRFIPGVY